MKNILLIIQREYLTRVKKKSFILMTLLVPVLMMLMMAGIVWAASTGKDVKNILILDDSGLFEQKIANTASYTFQYIGEGLEEAKKDFEGSGNEALVYIPVDIMENTNGVQIFAEQGVPLELQSKVERAIEREIESIKLTEAGITRSVLDDAKLDIGSRTISIKEGQEEESSSGAASAIGMICGFLIYMTVFIFGAQVMRGVMEEKTSRIVEVIISSVKPFQLLIGKIVGVALVGLTQFSLWIVFVMILTFGGGQLFGDKLGLNNTAALMESQMAGMSPEAKEAAMAQMQAASMDSGKIHEVIAAANTLPIATIVICFLFYFLGGYLIYSALFGAVGSAVDAETDSQQFMLPITLPLIASIIIAQFVMQDPHGPLAFWTSMIPFTSPVIMMVRIPFGVPVWQLVVSISLLIGGFVFTTWIASRIYRVGILMYGKKVSWKELSKWLFYKG